MSAANARPAGEIVPLSDRLRYTQMFRLAVVFGVALAIALSPDLVAVETSLLVLTTGGYLLLIVLGFALWRMIRSQAVTIFGALLIADGIFLAWLSHATGGSASPLRYLILLHLVTVALLASYRTGLKLAMWHSLLLWVGYQAQQSDLVPYTDAARGLAGSELDRLVLFALMVWIATLTTASFSAVNERELRRRRFDSDALASMAGELEGADEPLEVAEVLLKSVTDAFDLDRGVILASAEGDVAGLLPLAQHGNVDAAAAGASSAPAGSVVQHALTGRRTLLVSLATPQEDPWLAAVLPGAEKLVLVPLAAEGKPMGVLVVEHQMKAGTRIERRVVGALERSASHGALALRNAWLLLKLRESAQTDGLTGIPNRRTFDESLGREISRAMRSGEELSLVLLDIDHFKKLNDTFGHQVGDEVLRRVAQALHGATRGYDVAARYGGEEFAIVLPRTPHGDAALVAERLRRAAVDCPGEPGVTLSAGVATLAPAEGEVDGAALIAAADAALYVAKRAGRDQLVVSGAEPAVPAVPAEPVAAPVAAAPVPTDAPVAAAAPSAAVPQPRPAGARRRRGGLIGRLGL